MILVYLGRWSYGRFKDDNNIFYKMKNDQTTGTWQDNIWCPIIIILFCTSDVVFDIWLEICFLFLVSSIQVARLACVLIGSLAKLSSSFCKQSVLVHCRWLMLSLARWSHQWLSFGFKGLLWYLTLSWFSAKNEVMLLTILVVLNCIRFWIETFAYRVCLTRPRQVLDRTFCYQSLTVLNCIRFWEDPLLFE